MPTLPSTKSNFRSPTQEEQHMSIEQNIADLTLAIRELTVAISGKPSIVADSVKTEAKKSPAVTKPADTQPTVAVEKAAVQGKKVEASVVSRDGVTEAFKILAVKDRSKAIAILADVGAAKLSEVKDDKLAEVNAAIQVALS
jgi:hypothetical protein